MKSIMSHDFATTPRIDAPRSRFDRSFAHKTTMDAGWLVPLYWDSVLPGDTFNMNATIFARLQTPINPIMDNLFVDMHYFFIPNRLIWDNWRKFCGEQVDPGDSIDYSIPILAGTDDSDPEADIYHATPATQITNRVKALINYLGVPHGIDATDVDISALPARAYALTYNEWFRDQNLIDSLDVATDDGPDTPNTHGLYLQKRGKRHDYFTSALPWPQKGDAVSLPLGTSAPIQAQTSGSGQPTWQLGAELGRTLKADGTTTNVDWSAAFTSTGVPKWQDPQLEVDLTSATASTINDIREAFQVQKLLERDARAGTRYSEIINNHFGVQFYDVSYRPEFLGSSSTPINISPIARTGNGIDTTPAAYGAIGDLGAMGTASMRSGFNKTFVEHGIVMGICSVRADLTYQQGLNRHFSHSTRYDIYWPSLAHLGEQAILNKEIYCDGSANDDLVFGYIPRYDEYRYKPSMITGIFQSAASSSLESWHLSQEFSSLPSLGQTFIEETPPIDRCVNIPTEPHIILDSYFDLKCARPMPVNGTPGMIDHF